MDPMRQMIKPLVMTKESTLRLDICWTSHLESLSKLSPFGVVMDLASFSFMNSPKTSKTWNSPKGQATSLFKLDFNPERISTSSRRIVTSKEGKNESLGLKMPQLN